ncbi:MAG: hypothetical protein JO366_00645 [Methylobacteriaceae bacterium]|nr:hypothetical protein [Methylobacteriaceae bacterium]
MTLVSPPSPPPPSPPGGDQPAVTIPAINATWPKVLAICGSILVAGGVFIWLLLGVVYSNVRDDIKRIETKVDDQGRDLKKAEGDAAAFTTLLTEAPELRRNIQETHDTVIRHDDRLSNIEKKIDEVNLSVANVSKTISSFQASMDQLNSRTDDIARTVKLIPGLPR